jgi:uncharacterized membrane protein YeaQ/YmgE (transglycosylase-associated protein family)
MTLIGWILVTVLAGAIAGYLGRGVEGDEQGELVPVRVPVRDDARKDRQD